MEIRIGKTAHHCTACSAPFEHGERIVSLVRSVDHQLTREDYSQRCWIEDRAAGAIAMWGTQFSDPQIENQTPPEVYSPLRQTFYEHVESDNREHLAVAYLAAQLLRRQKVFRLLKESDDGEGEQRLALYTDHIGDRLIEVRDPSLTIRELENGRRQLMARLAELESPPSTDEASEEHVELEQV